MKSLDELITEYYDVIQWDHHKDRDCHFQIGKKWSYGNDRKFYIEHYGYLNELFVYDIPSYKEAEEILRTKLTEWIKEVEETKAKYEPE